VALGDIIRSANRPGGSHGQVGPDFQESQHGGGVRREGSDTRPMNTVASLAALLARTDSGRLSGLGQSPGHDEVRISNSGSAIEMTVRGVVCETCRYSLYTQVAGSASGGCALDMRCSPEIPNVANGTPSS
jgi:hypothetical protein